MEKGTRVGAIMSADKDSVRFFGYGTYEGEEVPPPEITFMGVSFAEVGVANPKIVLDSGKVVWGGECWWGEEEKVREMMEGRVVIDVDIDNARLGVE